MLDNYFLLLYNRSGTTETGSGTTETGSGTTESGSGTTTGTGETITTTITYTGSLVTTNKNIDYLYDNNGNLKQDNKYKYYYDYKNRLVKATNLVDETIVEFSYDVLNRRFLLRQGFEGQAPKTTKTFVYANENILQETTTDTITNTTKTRDYINGLGVDELVALEENSQRYYYHKDHLGSIVGLTNNNGDNIVEYDYDVFGKSKVISGDNSFDNTRLYTGREYDSELGLYYNRARYYNPELARFISRDPIDIADDVNLYAYVGNNGVMFVDRSGLSAKNLITERLIISIFDLALENTGGFNFFVFREGTKNGGAFDIKRNPYISNLADKNNGKIMFNGVEVDASNLGNLLAGFNMENSYLPAWKVRDYFMKVEVNNALDEGYGKYSKEIAKYDEYSDEIWYDEGEDIYNKYKNATSEEEKINIITNAIKKQNPEYNRRSEIEKSKRTYYSNLINNSIKTGKSDEN